MVPDSEQSTITKKKLNYTHFLEFRLKCAGCWDWYKKPQNDFQIVINNIYLCFVLFMLVYEFISLVIHMYDDWTDILACLDVISDIMPLVTSVFVVSYFSMYKSDLYELLDFMNDRFKWRSARGLTNMTMEDSYRLAKSFGLYYTSCIFFSISMYVISPVAVHFWTKTPLEVWVYKDVTHEFVLVLIFIQQYIAQGFVGLAMGQLGVFFACITILLCGQLDLLCCCLRNVQYTALLQNGVNHKALVNKFSSIELDEENSYMYNRSEMRDTCYHNNNKSTIIFLHGQQIKDRKLQFDIYKSAYHRATFFALQDCARMSQVVKEFSERFKKLASPLLVLRVIQVTLYLCTLLFVASIKFEMATVEYLAASALDMFLYCYFGNQITLQSDRVSLAGYQSAWPRMDVKSRRLLLNILLANRRPTTIRAGGLLPINLETFIKILKTSFSYYTLLQNVNE